MNDTYRITTRLNDGLAEAPGYTVQTGPDSYHDALIEAVREELTVNDLGHQVPVGATILIERVA